MIYSSTQIQNSFDPPSIKIILIYISEISLCLHKAVEWKLEASNSYEAPLGGSVTPLFSYVFKNLQV